MKALLSFALGLSAAALVAAPVGIDWQADGSGSYSGSFTDTAHWALGAYEKPYPQEGSYAYIRPGVHHSVEFPVGAFTNAADFKILAYNGASTTLLGAGTEWVLPTVDASGNYNVSQSAAFLDAGGLVLGHAEPGDATTGRIRFTDFEICLTNDNAGSTLLDFRKGSYNWYDGTGAPWTSTWIHFNQNSTASSTIRFGAGTSSKFTNTRFNFMNSEKSVIDFAGGTHAFMNGVQFPNPYMNFNAEAESLWNIKVRNGASLTFNASLTIGGSGSKGTTAKKTIRIEADDGDIAFAEGYDLTLSTAGRQEIQLRNGSTFAVRCFQGGDTGDVTGRIEVSSGSTLTAAARFILGPAAAADALTGCCDLAVTNGTVDLSAADASYITVNAGTVTLADGGRFIAPKLAAGSGAGQKRVHLVADGGVLVPTAAETSYFSGFDTARVDAGGLILETAYDVTVAQDFTDTGPLTLKGDGVVTLTGALPGLRLGVGETAGTLKVAAGTTLACAGDIEVSAARLVFTGSFPVAADPYVIATTPGDVTGAEAWAKAVVLSGIPSTVATDFTVDKKDGLARLLLTVREPVVHEENLASGEETRSHDIRLGPQDVIQSTVSPGAKLTLEGELSAGWLNKYGSGALTVSNPQNAFTCGFSLFAGLLSVTDPAALGFSGGNVASILAGGTLELGATHPPATLESPIRVEASGAVVIKADADLTMPLPTMASGAVIKRGAGRLVFAVDGNATLEALSDQGTLAAGYSFAFDGQGTVPDQPCGALNVAEGELVFRGTTATPPVVTSAVNSKRTIVTGLATSTPSTDEPGAPTLVLDHVKFVHNRDQTRFLTQPYVTAEGQSVLPSCGLVVSNGATLLAANIELNSNGKLAGPVTKFRVEDATVDMGYLFPNENVNHVGITMPTNEIEIVRDSCFKTDRISCTGNVTFDVDDSELRGRSGETIDLRLGGDRAAQVNFKFRNGAVFRCQGLVYQAVTATKVSGAQFRLAFDDAEWFAGDADRNIASSNLNVRIALTGKGVTFAPPENRTWRLHTRTEGTGGLVKRGAGTLRIVTQEQYCEKAADPLVYAATGVIDVQEGTLAVENGAIAAGTPFCAAEGTSVDFGGGSFTNVTLAGDGAYANGTLTDAAIAVPYGTEAAPTLGADLVLDGTVTVDFTGSGETVVAERTVARYEGAAPDLTGWKVRRGSLPQGYSASLAVDTSSKCVKATVGRRGMMLIFR